MVFSSNIFLFGFLPVFLAVYFFLKKDFKNSWLLLASVFFYAWGEPSFVLVILGVLVVDFYIVRRIWSDSLERNRRWLLALSVTGKLGLLCYYKYSNFFVDNFNTLLAGIGSDPVDWVKIALPIGVSFFTFQSISYSVDVYRGTAKPLDSIRDYLLYILLFPQLIAGPIVRYNDIVEDIADRDKNETIDNKLAGFYRFVLGLSKKILIANLLGEQADMLFNAPADDLYYATAWLAAICYTFQIYFDFSGYSDMAIGIGKMIGFRFPENFDNPYVSRSITEFWRRWHITLGQFMKDYLYIPLGGNRGSKAKVYFNLWIVFIASGFWHGAGWNFIVWGVFHGFFLVMDRVFLNKFHEKIGKIPSVVFTFFLVIICLLYTSDAADD